MKLERRTSRLSCLHISLSIEAANNLFDCFSYCIADLAVNNTVLRLGQIICVGYSTRYGGALFVPLIGYRQSTLVRELHLRCALLSIAATTTSSTSRSCVCCLMLIFINLFSSVMLTRLLELTFTNLFFRSLSSP